MADAAKVGKKNTPACHAIRGPVIAAFLFFSCLLYFSSTGNINVSTYLHTKLMKVISKLPKFIKTPLMKAGMAAMTNPRAAMKRVALITLPLNIAVLMLPHFIKLAVLAATRSYDNISPRGQEQTDVIKKHRFAELVQRCQAAHRNSTQCFPYASGRFLWLPPQGFMRTDKQLPGLPLLQVVCERRLGVLRHRQNKSSEIASTGGLLPVNMFDHNHAHTTCTRIKYWCRCMPILRHSLLGADPVYLGATGIRATLRVRRQQCPRVWPHHCVVLQCANLRAVTCARDYITIARNGGLKDNVCQRSCFGSVLWK